MTGGRAPAEAASAIFPAVQAGSPMDAAATAHTRRNSLRLRSGDPIFPNPFLRSSSGSIGASSRMPPQHPPADVTCFRQPGPVKERRTRKLYTVYILAG